MSSRRPGHLMIAETEVYRLCDPIATRASSVSMLTKSDEAAAALGFTVEHH